MDVLALVLGLVGAFAWAPIIIDWILICHRKIYTNVVDDYMVTEAWVTTEDKKQTMKGTVLLIATNLFVSKKSYFVDNYNISVKLKSGTVSKAIITDGSISINTPQGIEYFRMPADYNFNLHREIISDKDNIRIFQVFLVNTQISNVHDIESITFNFKNNTTSKELVIETADFPRFNRMKFLSKYISKA